MTKITLLFTLLFLTSFAISQPLYHATSKNGKFYGHCEKVSKKEVDPELRQEHGTHKNFYEFKYYNLETKKPVLKYQFYGGAVDSIRIDLSPDGKLISLRVYRFSQLYTSSFTHLINAQTKALLKKYEGIRNISFPNSDNSYVISTPKQTYLHESFTGKRLRVFDKASHSVNYGKTWFSKDDKYLIQQRTENRFNLWETNRHLRLSSQIADEFAFDYKNDKIAFLKGYRIKAYSLKDMTLLYQKNLAIEVREFTKKKKTEDRKIQIEFKKALLSNSGNYIIIPFSVKRKNGLLLCSTTRSEYKEIPIEDFPPVNHLEWFDESHLLLHHENNTISVIDLNNIPASENLDFGFSTRVYNPQKPIIFGPTFNYIIRGKKELSGSGVRLQDRNGNNFQFSKYDFIEYTPETEYLIVQSKKTKEYGLIKVNDALNSKKPKFYPFGDSVKSIVEPVYEDVEIPEDYEPNQITKFKHISELKDTSALIRLVLKNVEFTDSTISINTHLIDEDGVYYYGAGTEEWKNIWCNFLLQRNGGQITQLTDFEVIEHRSNPKVPFATAIIMDHSGSMGPGRATKIQKEVANFIDKKNGKDGIALIKFDDKIKIESYTTNSKSKLQSELGMDGLKGFGGGTSLLDGANAGISVLKDTTNYIVNSIVLLTDGLENSSFISRNRLISKALKNNIQVYIVGYGKHVDVPYLKSIAYNTNGSYYQIYRRTDFEWIFKDIEYKTRNFYEIKFKSDTVANHNAALKVCITKKQNDTLALSINNKPFEDDFTEEDLNILDEIKTEEDIDKLMVKPEIEDFSMIKTSLHAPDTLKQPVKDNQTQKIIEEFEVINLPNLKFEHNSTIIIEESLEGMDEVRDFLKKYPKIRIEIAGHTDSDGDDDSNMDLSQRRAERIKELLVREGINQDRIEAKGYGELIPLVENDSEENKQKNRRVEFVILE